MSKDPKETICIIAAVTTFFAFVSTFCILMFDGMFPRYSLGVNHTTNEKIYFYDWEEDTYYPVSKELLKGKHYDVIYIDPNCSVVTEPTKHPDCRPPYESKR